MFLFKKEKEVVEFIEKHLDVVDLCMTTALQTLESYLGDKLKDAKKLSRDVDAIETQADLIRHQIRDQLYLGAYLPGLREDIYRLVASVDEVANAAESCCDFFLNQRPVFPPELRAPFLTAARESLGIINPLKKAALCFLRGECPPEVARGHGKEVGLKESDVDKIEWDLTKLIFTASLDFAHKIHLKLCLDAITLVSDKAKDAADQLDLVTLKSMT